MKKFKLIPAVTFLLVFFAYYGIFTSYSDPSFFTSLSDQDKITYLNLEENDQIKIIGLPQDSVEVKPDFSDSAKIVLSALPNETYTTYQTISTQSTDVSEKHFMAKRFILLAFVFITAYLSYTKKHKFNVAFQKILFENVVTTLVFALLSGAAFLLVQKLRGSIGDPSYALQMLFGDAIESLKYGLLYSIFIAIFIYFDPRNINWYQKRLAKKKATEEKEAAKNQ